MATLASLVVELRAETAAFRREMAAASASRASFEKGVVGMGRNVGAAFAGLISAAAVTRALTAIVRETSAAEQSTARLAAVLKATGGTAGRTGTELESLAQTMEAATLFDDADIRNAMATLATFRSVSGAAFERTIALAGDLSSVFGGDLSSAATQLGKALEDPVEGLSALKRVGVSFSAAQKDTIKQLVETNRLAEAQAVILDTLATQVGGTAAALAGEGSISAALNKARDEWQAFQESLGQSPGLVAATSGLAALLQHVNAVREAAANKQGDLALFDAEAEAAQLEAIVRTKLKSDDRWKRTSTADSRMADLQGRSIFDDNSDLAGDAKRYVEALWKVSAINDKLLQQARERRAEETKASEDAARKAKALAEETAAENAHAAAVERATKLATEQKQARESVLSALEQEHLALVLTAEDLQLTALIAANATKAELDFARATQQSIKQLKDLQSATEQYNASAEAFAAVQAAGAKARSEEFGRQAEETRRLMQEGAATYEVAWVRAIENVQDAISSAMRDLFTGQIESARDFAQRLLAMMADVFAQIAAAQAAAGIVSAVGSAAFSAGGGGLTGFYHGGGVVGTDAPSSRRHVPDATFVGAPRLHGGYLAGDEFPAILQRGETVLTPAQMKAMGGGGGSRTTVKVSQTFPITIQAIDRRDVAQFFDENIGQIQGAVARGIRDSRSFARHVRGS